MSDVIVLCYHALSDSWQTAISVTPTQFEKQLGLLAEKGYRGATLEQALSAPPAPKTVAITFDDAFRSVFQIAFPLLSRFEMPATLFVPTRRLRSDGPMAWPGIDHWVDGPDEQELVGMSWEQIKEVVDAGWQIGSHTKLHPHLPELDDVALAAELRDSRRDCEERLHKPCSTLAYPYGDFDRRVIEAAGEAGYLYAVTLDRPDVEEPLCWPRVGVYYQDDLQRFRRKVSPVVRRLRTTPLWPLITRTRNLTRRVTRRRKHPA